MLSTLSTKTARRSQPVPGTAEAKSVRSGGRRLTLRGTLHYLWDEVGLNRWTPAMADKRLSLIVRNFLLQVAENKAAKHLPLGESLFTTETFQVEHRDKFEDGELTKLLPARMR